jgi:hypothetical protein
MRTYFALCLLLSLALIGCQIPSGGIDLSTAVRDGVLAADRDRDGALSKEELRGVKNDPIFWITIANSLASIFGLAKAQSAQRTAAKVENEVDEQWDRQVPK